MPTFWQFGAVAPQSFIRLLNVVPDSTWLAGGAAGAAGTAAPEGRWRSELAAIEAESVPGSTWKNRKALVGTAVAAVAGLGSAAAVLMAFRLVKVLNVARLLVATTSTFHHSGSPPLRVLTTWLCAGMGTASRVAGLLTPRYPANSVQVDGRRVVDAGGRPDALGRRRREADRHRNV